MNCQDRTDSIHLYAAGALPDAEVDELRRHLATGCPQCVAELSAASAVAAMLPLSLDPVNPPAGLKDRLMRRIDDDIAQSANQQRRMKIAPAPAPVQAVDTLAVRIYRLFVPAAVAAGITLVATHFYMNRKVNDARSQAAVYRQNAIASFSTIVSMSAKLEAAQKKLQDQTKLVEQLTVEKTVDHGQLVSARHDLDVLKKQYESQAAIVAMLETQGVRLVDLTPTDLQKGAVAHLVWDESHRKWAVMVAGMKPAAAGETYELWFVTTAGAKVRAGVFDVDPAGDASVMIDLPKDLGPLQLVAVTNEKAGGVDQPQGQFQITGKL